MSHTRRKYIDVPMKIDGNLKYVKGVSKYTTCGDVIKMVLKKTEEGKENGTPEAFGIYESSRGIERLLPAKSRVLKVMRSWGMDADYEFIFRKVNTAFVAPKMSEAKRRKLTNRQRSTNKYENVEKLAGLVHSHKTRLNKHDADNEFVKEIYFNDSDSSMDEFISHVDKSNMKGFLNFCGAVSAEEINKLSSASQMEMSRNMTGQSDDFELVRSKDVTSTIQNNVNDVKYAVRKSLKTKTCSVADLTAKRLNNLGTEIHTTPNLKAAKEQSRTIKRHDKLANDIATKIARMNQKEGKEALLQKYFADYITYRSPGYKFRDSRFRERGDGAETNSEYSTQRQITGSENKTAKPKRKSSQTSLTFQDYDTSSDSGQEDEILNFDTAFISDVSEINHGYREPHVSLNYETSREDSTLGQHEVDLNTACVGKLVDYSLSEEDSLLADPSDISSISTASENIVHNVSSVSDIVKAIFNENREVSEDDEMESFMKTKLWDEFSDEGLSSLGSEDEKEIIV
ncbi:uncharacterized protein LOC123536391 [Mercenaria mercenaria]|uniref:uncharacterized protein LOC123536391 n=1 Tax=Mercenaria mercenaria TaxID=6596 RepID=UPI00234F4776|nr:uncharacterized protein LOC123536391 [Mercenaria mercenaria]